LRGALTCPVTGTSCEGRQIARILIAAAAEPRAVLERVLPDHDLFFAETLAQALKLLSERSFDLVICTIAFDETRMLELLGFAKANPEWKSTPFICARVRHGIVSSPSARKAVAFTCRQLGAAAFLDVADYPVDAERGMREAIEAILQTSVNGTT
jgi:CheY-like chemotaxis protein